MANTPEMSKALRQLAIALLAALLWVGWGEPRAWALLACYGVALTLAEAARRSLGHVPGERLGAGRFAVAALVLGAAPAATLIDAAPRTLRAEGLYGVEAASADRMRLERTPSLAPGVLFADHPQELYAWAPGATSLTASLGEASLPVTTLGHGLFRLAYDPRDHGAPARSGDVTVALVVDGDEHRRSLRVVVRQPHPGWPCADPRRGVAVVPSDTTDEVAVIGRRGLHARLPVGDGPTGCALLADGRVAIAHRFDPDVWVTEVPGGDPERLRVGAPQHAIAASADGETLAVAVHGAAPAVHVLGLGGDHTSFPVEEGADGVAFGPTSGTVLLALRRRARVERWDERGGRFERTGEIPLGRPVVTMAPSVDHATLWVATTGYFPVPDDRQPNHYVQDQLLAIDVASMRLVGRYPTAGRSHTQDRPGAIDRGASPMGLWPLPGGELLVAFAGTDEVWRLDPRTGMLDDGRQRLETSKPDLRTPIGVADLGDGHVLVTSAARGRALVFRDGAVVASADLALAGDELARDDERAWLRRFGEHTFFEATRAGMSCQSCHLHGDSDHVRHDIGAATLLPTLTTLGVTGTAPYLRDASYPRIRDLLELSEGHLRGFQRFDPRRGEQLEAYLEALPRHDPLAVFGGARDVEAERRGLDAFVRARCVVCHTPPAFTNLGQHPARALFPEHADALPAPLSLDTPSLLGLRATAPYLRDGRAATLEEVLVEHNEQDRHGHTAALSDAERRDLIAFLEAL